MKDELEQHKPIVEGIHESMRKLCLSTGAAVLQFSTPLKVGKYNQTYNSSIRAMLGGYVKCFFFLHRFNYNNVKPFLSSEIKNGIVDSLCETFKVVEYVTVE